MTMHSQNMFKKTTKTFFKVSFKAMFGKSDSKHKHTEQSYSNFVLVFLILSLLNTSDFILYTSTHRLFTEVTL